MSSSAKKRQKKTGWENSVVSLKKKKKMKKRDSKKAYPFKKDLTTVKHGKGTTTQDHLGNRLTEED